MTILSSIQAPAASDGLEALTSAKSISAPAATVVEAESLFAASLEKAATAKAATAAEPDARPVSAVYRGSKSGVLTPVQQFESFVLRSFVETMLPKDNTSFFGTGTAGQIWKSMLAERIGDEMAKDGGIGIADLLSKRDTAAQAAATAKAASAATDGLSVDAVKLQGAGSSL